MTRKKDKVHQAHIHEVNTKMASYKTSVIQLEAKIYCNSYKMSQSTEDVKATSPAAAANQSTLWTPDEEKQELFPFGLLQQSFKAGEREGLRKQRRRKGRIVSSTMFQGIQSFEKKTGWLTVSLHLTLLHLLFLEALPCNFPVMILDTFPILSICRFVRPQFQQHKNIFMYCIFYIWKGWEAQNEACVSSIKLMALDMEYNKIIKWIRTRVLTHSHTSNE